MTLKSGETAGRVKLFTTLGCHLCDQAAALLVAAGLKVEKVEIADNDELFDRYGLRIPVVSRGINGPAGQELEGPFDAEQLTAWLDSGQP